MGRPVEVELGEGPCHERAHNDEGAADSPWRDGRQDWREKDGDQEVEGADHGREAGLGPGLDAGAALDVGCDGREPEERA